MLKPGIGVIGMSGQYEVGFDAAPGLLRKAVGQLQKLGGDISAAEEVIYDAGTLHKAIGDLKYREFDLLCVCVCTWSDDHHLLDLLEHISKPVVLWAFPATDTGSLCGVQQICCVLKELGKQYFYVYGEADDPTVLDEIRTISRAVSLVAGMKHVKIGTVCGRVGGMTEIAYDEFEIKDRTGARVVNLDESDLAEELDRVQESFLMEFWRGIEARVGRVISEKAHCLEAVRYYLATKQLVAKNDLAGICFKCYTRLMGKICLGYSLLAEEGIVCGCEGDVNATVAMKMLYELTGKPIHNTDPMITDAESNTILFSHCGCGGFSLAGDSERIHLAPIRLANTGVAVLFPATPGRVTLVNLIGRKGTYRMSVMVGDAVECGMEFPGNPLKVSFVRDILEINRQIAKEGIGHHWMCGYGDVSEELKIFCELNGIRYIRL